MDCQPNLEGGLRADRHVRRSGPDESFAGAWCNHMGGGHMQITYWRRELEILERLLASAEHRTYRQCYARGCHDVTAGVIAQRRARAESIRRWLAEQDKAPNVA